MARSMWARWIGWSGWAVCWVWPMMGAWTPAARAATDCGCAPCDFDLDGDVDLDDYAQLQNCLSGFGIPQNNPACLKARLDGDTDVDGQDVAVFKACLTGANVPYPGTNLPVVAINEFVASNGSGLTDEDGNHPDWIELYVPCAASIDLGGWFLTDDPDDLQKWSFPPTVLNRGQYLVVFASGNDRRVSGQPLHTNFQIDKDGGFLALVRPDGQTIEHGYLPSYPQQARDVAFGLSQLTTQPIAPRAVAHYRVPTAADAGLGDAWTDPDFPDADWPTGLTGLGFSSIPADFEVKVYRSKIAVDNLATAESVIADPTKQASVSTGRFPVINLRNTGGSGNYPADDSFPGLTLGTDANDFVVLITSSVVIPTAGEWTFGVNSSDGFNLRLTRGSITYESSYPEVRELSETLKVFDVAQAGMYTLRLVCFERSGDASVELYAAPGYWSLFDGSKFRLVGDAAGGGLTVGSIGADIVTDVSPAMRGMNGSLWVRVPFTLEDPAIYSTLTLRMRYEDGYAAYLNGQVVARKNAPAGLLWNSTATINRPNSQAANPEDVDISGFASLLRPGLNVLAVHGLNDTAGDADFQVLPELILSSNGLQTRFFAQPTPGAPNAAGMNGVLQPVAFDPPRGFYNQAFQLTLSTSSPAAEIRYTLDGSEPTATAGFVYTGPILIDRTRTVRAAAFQAGFISPVSTTHTYLFVNDIMFQSPQGQPPGPNWPSGPVNGQILDYGMDPDIVNNPRWSSLIDDALLAIPSISLVTDLKHLFDPNTGIYTHAGNDGRAWERPVSMELINPDGKPGFQINAGLRIRGGYSRSGDNPKHAFRLFFRWVYGEGKLHFPLFEDEGVDEFDHIDLRTAQNYCWSFNGDSRMTMSRDVFTRDNQGAMGQPYTRSRFYHLYINGQYWGIYQTEERPEADFAASYFGGRPEDYDVVKVEAGPYTINATDGDTNAWYRVYQAAQAGFASNEAYFKVQGLNPDGTPNPAYENLVDVDNLIDFNICTYYGGDLDGPISAFLGNNAPNNYYVSRDRTGKHGGFKSFKHDAEHTLLNVNEDRTGPYPAGSEFSRFNPQYLHQKLADNAEYRLRFADHVHKHFFNNGVLTPQAATQRFLARTNQIQMAIIAESARWGDSKVSTPLNRDDHWQPAVNTIVNSYLPNRTNVVLNQFKSKGWYPAVQAPQFNHYGGNVPNGFAVVMSRPAGQGGTIYYTTDGSDPRLIGGAVSGSASVYNDGSATQTFIAKGTQWRFLDDGSNQGTAWQAINFPAESTWKLGNTQIGWGDGDETTVIPSNRRSFTTYYFRKSFQVPAGTVCTSLTANLLRDDGAAVYLNATTPVTINMPASWTYQTPANTCIGNPDESTFFALPLAPANLVTGTNVLAVEVHQCPSSTSDLSFDLELVGVVQTNPTVVVVDRNMIVKARILDGGQWSALTEAVYLVTPANVVINEFMADNKTTLEDPQEPGEFPDWIELYNPNVLPVELGGMYLSDDPANPTKYRIPNGVSIGPGQFVVFLADDDGTQGPLHTNFKLNDDGEHVVLTAKDGTTVIDSISFGKQTADVAAGRYPDGGGAWGPLQAPTPGGANTPLR